MLCPILGTEYLIRPLSPHHHTRFQKPLGPHEQLPLPSTDNDASISCLSPTGHPASTVEHWLTVHTCCSLLLLATMTQFPLPLSH